MEFFYRDRHPDGPFATLIAVTATSCHLEACGGGHADLVPGPGHRKPVTTRPVSSRPGSGMRPPAGDRAGRP